MSAGYRKSDRKWNGRDMFECKSCPYNGLDESRVAEHVDTSHKIRPVSTGILDDDGKLIYRIPGEEPPEREPTLDRSRGYGDDETDSDAE